MNRLMSLIFFYSIFLRVDAQQPVAADSVRRLEEVIVKAYAAERPLMEVPAAIGMIDTLALNRFNNTSLLPALNTIPGVRMEERSPGSYRLSIRGSTLRSPFGVRNVKIYWNGLPLTDGGGNTYLNILDMNSINHIEVVKGPGASLYGAGTGGVVLLDTQLKNETSADVHFMAGSYGLLRYGGSAQFGNKKGVWKATVSKQQADGYREHTAMSRLIGQLVGITSVGKKSTLSFLLLASNLDYQTPGGLTKAQYEADPRQARPSTPTQPGAVAQQAAISNATIYSGLVHDINWSDAWHTRTGIYGSSTNFENPAILNYEKRWEGNLGGRTETQYKFVKPSWQGKITFGGEFQYLYSPVEVYNNDLGVAGTVRTIDTLASRAVLGFAQAEFDLPAQFYLTVGGSSNFLKYHFERSAPATVIQDRKFDLQVSPRIALLKKITPFLSAYGSVSSGFSPPTLAEVRPSTGNFNNTLNPERGTSYELGMKGQALKQLTFDVTAYDFHLRETIVIQRTPDGADYFINAGETSQKGFEAKVYWDPRFRSNNTISSFRLWTSYALNNYHFKDYVNDSKDYSGNLLTGVAPNVAVLGLDVVAFRKFYINATSTYVDHTPLNDANTEFATEYFLVGARGGYKTHISRVMVEVFGGVDNLLDQKYSLGNDLNAQPAANGRYYNVAAGRNFYAGISLKIR